MRGLILILVFVQSTLYAQNKPGTELHIKKAKGVIVLDGKLEEDDWSTA